jgi:hypothetical protein
MLAKSQNLSSSSFSSQEFSITHNQRKNLFTTFPFMCQTSNFISIPKQENEIEEINPLSRRVASFWVSGFSIDFVI